MIVREATDADIVDVLDMAAAFCAHAGEPFDTEHTLVQIAGIRHAGFLLVAEHGGQLRGMIAAVTGPCMCAPVLRMHEVSLWVRPGHRDGHALLLLLREFDRRAEAAGVHSAQLSDLTSSPPSLRRIFQRMGYLPAGTAFIKHFGST